MSILDRIFGNRNVDQLADALSNEIVSRMASKFQEELTAIAEVDQATAQVVELRKQLAVLEAEKANIAEGFNRKEREIEHKTGLLRQEIEAEQRQSKKDFDLRVQEAKLAAKEVAIQEREKAFTEKMQFIEERFTEEVGYLKGMVKDMSDRLPSAAILATKEL